MGSDNAYFIQGKRLEKMQNQHDPELLKKIASISGGSFLEARDRDAMAAALDSIDKMVKTEFKQKTFHEYKELFPFLLIAGGIVLLAGIILQFSLFLDFP